MVIACFHRLESGLGTVVQTRLMVASENTMYEIPFCLNHSLATFTSIFEYMLD